MGQFYGTDQVRRQEKRLSSNFDLIKKAAVDQEIQAHYARYLSIRVAGYAEQSLKDLVSAYARHHGSAPLHSYVESKVNRIWGIDRAKLEEVINGLDKTWWSDLLVKMPQELDSLNSVGKIRNNVSHGGDQGVTLDTVTQYRDDVIKLVRYLCELLDPRPNS